MIVILTGNLERWDSERSALWITSSGITYEVNIPAFAREWAAAHEAGKELRVHTYYHATERQPTPTLYGFPYLAEREFFRKFIDVPDMGPAKAIRALTRPVSEIAGWIEAEDRDALKQLPGIGDRLAQTIVAHLRGRLIQEALLRDSSSSEHDAISDLRSDAIDALVALQYPRREAQRVIANALTGRPDLTSLEDVLRYVLEQRA